jgi:hypothetical protein
MVMNAGERGLSRSNLTDTWYFYFLSSICEKAAHLFGWVDRGRVAAGVQSGLANGGRS